MNTEEQDALFEHWLDEMCPEIADFEEGLAPGGWEGGILSRLVGGVGASYP